jgi:hypothetical protein
MEIAAFESSKAPPVECDLLHRHPVKNLLNLSASDLAQEFAAEPDCRSRQLQEKADGVAPAGLFSWVPRERKSNRGDGSFFALAHPLMAMASNRRVGCASSLALSTMRISSVPRAAVRSSTAKMAEAAWLSAAGVSFS